MDARREAIVKRALELLEDKGTGAAADYVSEETRSDSSLLGPGYLQANVLFRLLEVAGKGKLVFERYLRTMLGE